MPSSARLLLLVALVAACQGDTLPVGGDEPLDQDAVENLPSGSGVGDAASGAYSLTRSERRGCNCSGADEAGLCETTLAGTGLSLTQDDGALQLQLLDAYTVVPDVVLEGGVDQSGLFVVGGVNDLVINGIPFARNFDRVEGTVQPGEGGELEWTRRSTSSVGDASSDCTLTFEMEFEWWSPDSVGACTQPAECHPQLPYCSNFVCTDGSAGTACGFSFECASGFCVDDVCTTGAPGARCDFDGDCVSQSCGGSSCD